MYFVFFLLLYIELNITLNIMLKKWMFPNKYNLNIFNGFNVDRQISQDTFLSTFFKDHNFVFFWIDAQHPFTAKRW